LYVFTFQLVSVTHSAITELQIVVWDRHLCFFFHIFMAKRRSTRKNELSPNRYSTLS